MNFLLHFSHTLVMETGNWLLGGTIYQEKKWDAKKWGHDLVYILVYDYMPSPSKSYNSFNRSWNPGANSDIDTVQYTFCITLWYPEIDLKVFF